MKSIHRAFSIAHALVAILFACARTLSKMNAFDLVVTVSLGSTLATVLLAKDVALADGALAFGLLVGLQFLVTWSSVRARWARLPRGCRGGRTGDGRLVQRDSPGRRRLPLQSRRRPESTGGWYW